MENGVTSRVAAALLEVAAEEEDLVASVAAALAAAALAGVGEKLEVDLLDAQLCILFFENWIVIEITLLHKVGLNFKFRALNYEIL